MAWSSATDSRIEAEADVVVGTPHGSARPGDGAGRYESMVTGSAGCHSDPFLTSRTTLAFQDQPWPLVPDDGSGEASSDPWPPPDVFGVSEGSGLSDGSAVASSAASGLSDGSAVASSSH